MANLRLQPKTACSRLPPVEMVDLRGQQRVDMARSPSRRRMAGVCAKLTFEVVQGVARLGGSVLPEFWLELACYLGACGVPRRACKEGEPDARFLLPVDQTIVRLFAFNELESAQAAPHRRRGRGGRARRLQRQSDAQSLRTSGTQKSLRSLLQSV